MSKHIDWNQTYSGIDVKRARQNKEAGRPASLREYFQKANSNIESAKSAHDMLQRYIPVLKECLLKAMIERRPITVLKPFHVTTEIFEKSEDREDDLGRYLQGFKEVPAGTQLTFVRRDAMLNQWLFKSQTGEEFEIYESPVIVVGKNDQVKNPAYWGVMLNTSILEEARSILGDDTSTESEG